MSAQGYRENLREAQRVLDVALATVDEYKSRDLIVWGTTARGYKGWLVKGPQADEAYTALIKAKSDVEHWGGMLNDALRLTSVPQDRRLPPEHDDEASA